MLVITNSKNSRVNSTISRWDGDRNGCMRMWDTMSRLLKGATIWIRTQVALSSHELYRGKLMHIFGSKFTKTKESFIICKVKSKKTWILCFTTSTILVNLIMVAKVLMEDDQLLEEPQMRAAVTSYTAKMDHKLKEACALKTIFTSRRALWNLKNKNSIVSTRKL